MTPDIWLIYIVSPVCILLGYTACLLIKHKTKNNSSDKVLEIMSQHFIAMKELTEKFADLSCQQFNQLHNSKLFEVMQNQVPTPLAENDIADISDLLGAGQ